MPIIRAVLAGCGAMSKGWLNAIRSHSDLRDAVTVVGLVDLDPARAAALAAEFGLHEAETGADLDLMLQKLRPDAVFDVVVPAARGAVVEAALRRGAHVLSEKPMAPSLTEAQRMLDAAAAANRIHAVVQNRRYIAGVRRMRRLVAEGTLGEITAVHCDFFLGAHFGGFREEMAHVLLLDMAIHTFDALRFTIGQTPASVFCVETNPAGSWYAEGAAANAIFRFAGGAVATYRGSWVAEGANTSWEAAWRIIGTRGTLLWDGADDFSANVVAGGEGFMRPVAPVAVPDAPDPADAEGHASVIRSFVRALQTGEPPETTASDNVASLAMVLAAIESAETGQTVDIEIPAARAGARGAGQGAFA